MKVLALIDHLVLGGAEMLLGQFAAAAPSAGIELSVTALTERDGNPAALPLRAAGIQPVDLRLDSGRKGAGTILSIRRHLATERPDIVHTHLATSDVAGGIAARALGIPAVCTIHTVHWDRTPATNVKRRVVRLCHRRIVAVSESARRAYLARGWAAPGQIVTIHNGVDVRPEPGAGAAVRREFGWGPEHLVVGMVSALRPEKGHDVAIDAISRAAGQFPQLRLLIVGDGPEREEVARSAARLGDRVALAGRRMDVMRCFDAFDVCLHPSLVEAFPTTLIESLAAGVPILATAVGGIPEIVQDGRTAVLAPAPPRADTIAEQLVALLGDPGRRAAMTLAGQHDYRTRFTAIPWVRQTRAMYDAVLRERSGG